jgi:hypothetical protein
MHTTIVNVTTGEITQVPLTEAELAVFAQEKAIQDAKNIELAKTQYQRDRAKEYPPIGDQLDALWKGGEASTTMLAQVQAVKSKYPKPTE